MDSRQCVVTRDTRQTTQVGCCCLGGQAWGRRCEVCPRQGTGNSYQSNSYHVKNTSYCYYSFQYALALTKIFSNEFCYSFPFRHFTLKVCFGYCFSYYFFIQSDFVNIFKYQLLLQPLSTRCARLVEDLTYMAMVNIFYATIFASQMCISS